MSYIIEEWAKSKDIKVAIDNIRNRKTYIWGAYASGHVVREKMYENGIDIAGFIDAHKSVSEYMGKQVFKPEDVLSEKIYIIVAVEGIRDEIIRYLRLYSKVEDDDYYYVSNHIPDITILSVRGHYEDCYGNVIDTKERIDAPIRLIGYKNFVSIGYGCKFDKGIAICSEAGGCIEIGSDVITSGIVSFEALESGRLIIGNNDNFMDGAIIRARTSTISLGHFLSSGKNMFIMSGGNSPITIGNDCMISHDVSILSSSGHSIIDLVTKENIINSTEKHVVIGNHVWIGKSAIVLYNSEIGSGSIIGAGSVVKNVCKENNVLAGNPAKVISENRTWDRRSVDFEKM